MAFKSAALIALAASIPLVGCGRSEQTVTASSSRLIVTGSKDGVRRFTALQGSRTPALVVSTIKSLGDGRVEAVVTLPVGFEGQALVHTTREALAAGLSYTYQDWRSARTVRS